MKFKKDGTFDDIFNNTHNRIPYCVQDLHQLYDQFFDQEKVVMTRPAIQSLCQTAHLFIEEITSKPSFLSCQYLKQTLPPEHILKNIKAKFPEMFPQAEILYAKYLEKWKKPIVQESPVEEPVIIVEKIKKGRQKRKKQQQIPESKLEQIDKRISQQNLRNLRVTRAKERLERVSEYDWIVQSSQQDDI